MNLLITGGLGYIGSLLVPYLRAKGHKLRVVDLGWFARREEMWGDEILGDIRFPQAEWFDGVEAVIHLAGVSTDPQAGLMPDLCYSINAGGTATLAHYAKAAGVRRFIFASSCSVYGYCPEVEVDEDYPTRPAFPYAVSKLMGERALQCLTDEDFRAVVLRKGTVGGWAPRMRWDLVVNTMTASGALKQKIQVYAPLVQRPLLDIRDAVLAYEWALTLDGPPYQVFNLVGNNYSVLTLGLRVHEALRLRGIAAEVEVGEGTDIRSYRASAARAAAAGWTPRQVVGDTVWDILTAAQEGRIDHPDDPRCHNMQVFSELLASGRQGLRL